MPKDKLIETLRSLGMSELEARVYLFLLQESPATGYRIARAIGKATANTYQAVESLERKGLILVEEAGRRLCRAVPCQEMLSRLQRQFQESCRRAEQDLRRIGPAEGDDRVYSLRSREQVDERARAMLESAEEVVVIDAFPGILAGFEADIAATARRGVEVTVKTYASVEIPGVEVVVDRRGLNVVRAWPGQWLNIVVDAAEHMLAFFTSEGNELHQAVWSGSPFLSLMYYGGVTSEIFVDKLATMADAGTGEDEIRSILKVERPPAERELRGRRELMGRFERDNLL